MKTCSPLLTAPIVALSLGAADAGAQTLRCGADLVRIGDRIESVLRICGEPARRASTCVVPHTPNADRRTARPDPTRPCVDAVELTYRFGYGQPVTTLRFDDDVLRTITYGERQ